MTDYKRVNETLPPTDTIGESDHWRERYEQPDDKRASWSFGHKQVRGHRMRRRRTTKQHLDTLTPEDKQTANWTLLMTDRVSRVQVNVKEWHVAAAVERKAGTESDND